MGWTSSLGSLTAIGLLTVLLAEGSTAAPKKDPAGTAVLMGQLRLLFDTWDLNNDGYLDKQELAKAFRGSDAKPYEKPAAGSTTGSAKPDLSKYPDHVLLVELDVNSDGKISKAEFENWARDYAVSLKHQEQALKRLNTAEHKLATVNKNSGKLPPNELAAELKAAEEGLKKEQEAYKKLVNEEKAYDKHVQQAMKKSAKK